MAGTSDTVSQIFWRRLSLEDAVPSFFIPHIGFQNPLRRAMGFRETSKIATSMLGGCKKATELKTKNSI